MPENDQTAVSRREALGAMTVAGAAPFLLGSAALASQSGSLGWDFAAKRYTLPTLSYGYDALEPAIDADTMRIHHTKHHAGYVRGLNRALENLEAMRESGDAAMIKHWSRELAFHGAGHLSHTLFWLGMAPTGEGGGGEPTGDLAKAITRDFGSFAKFKAQFIAAASSVEGSGWGWLVHEPVAGRLMISQAEKHQNLSVTGAVPLLGVDVWEHAYYLRYQNRRADYITAFFDVIKWGEISARFDASRGKAGG